MSKKETSSKLLNQIKEEKEIGNKQGDIFVDKANF